MLIKYGEIVVYDWIKSAKIRREIELDEFIIIPNYLHGIIEIINDNHGRGDWPVAPTNSHVKISPRGPCSKSIGSMIAGFKSAVTKQISLIRKAPGSRLWQSNYWEHIIRSDNDLNRIT